ncbi:hypothetical protein L0663_05195 [Dyadobacter sp. CY107]|nr:hypothetical protein [Dyadobacter fanqingshengii]
MDINLVNQRLADLETHDIAGVVHCPADNRTAIHTAGIQLNFLIRNLDLGFQPPVKRDFINRWKENIFDLRVCWREIAGIDLRKLP